jgi:hypothetical protein
MLPPRYHPPRCPIRLPEKSAVGACGHTPIGPNLGNLGNRLGAVSLVSSALCLRRDTPQRHEGDHRERELAAAVEVHGELAARVAAFAFIYAMKGHAARRALGTGGARES